ncbi:hypothetical protein CDAR_500081 [Caerostris darwini]|uniref:Uncharacterized protein n=1 Tax=Caerostris darwini TaxID=1538125 RepID=A0AAV4M7F2_9ARAC|nr:hypothetical protein CDAR_500081 [Caerostris darwini]
MVCHQTSVKTHHFKLTTPPQRHFILVFSTIFAVSFPESLQPQNSINQPTYTHNNYRYSSHQYAENISLYTLIISNTAEGHQSQRKQEKKAEKTRGKRQNTLKSSVFNKKNPILAKRIKLIVSKR